MPLSARVAGIINSLWDIVRSSQAHRDCLHLIFRQVGCFLKEYKIPLASLILSEVLVSATISELQCTSVKEVKHVFALVIFRHILQLRNEDIDVVVQKFRERSPYEKNLRSRITDGEQLGFRSHRPRLSTASRTAETYVLRRGFEELPLLFARLVNC